MKLFQIPMSDQNKGISSIAYWRTSELPKTVTTAKGTINYTHDDAGNKLKKVTVETASAANGNCQTTTTNYVGRAVFESRATSPVDPEAPNYSNKLLFLAHEEGRIQALYNGAKPDSLTGFAYDYLIKDHLGNVRLVLTDEAKQDQYPAATEEALYSNLPGTRASKPSGYPADATTTPNDSVAVTNGGTAGRKIGPSITLKVMAGDSLSLRVSSWYKTGGTAPAAPADLVSDLAFMLSQTVAPASGKFAIAELQSSGIFTPGAADFFTDYGTGSSTRPMAFVSWVLFDEQLKYDSAGSGVEAVGGDGVFTLHVKTKLPVKKSGYLYVFVSNETPNIDMFFDNLQVIHTRGALLEETHYYPCAMLFAFSNKVLNTFSISALFQNPMLTP